VAKKEIEGIIGFKERFLLKRAFKIQKRSPNYCSFGFEKNRKRV
jgi:hypothetical protein